MAVFQFVFPAILGWVHREKADEAVGMCGHVVGYVLVIDPQAGEAGLAAEDDGLVAVLRARSVGFVCDGEV